MIDQEIPDLRDFEAQMLPMLLQAARNNAVQPAEETHPVKRWIPTGRRRWVAVSVALMAAAIAIIVPALSTDPLRGALAIERHGDFIFATVDEAAADPSTMTNDLRAAGLPFTVEAVPVSPDLVGEWVGVENDSGGDNDPRIVDLVNQVSDKVRTLQIPADFSSAVTLQVGQATPDGGRYLISSGDATDSAYACLGLQGMTPAEAEQSLASKGYEARWYFPHDDPPTTEVFDSPPANTIITDASFLGPTTVAVYVGDPGSKVTGRPAGGHAGEGC